MQNFSFPPAAGTHTSFIYTQRHHRLNANQTTGTKLLQYEKKAKDKGLHFSKEDTIWLRKAVTKEKSKELLKS